ncbi:PUA domain-containing protein [Spirosoma panaciterrae]|uniref:nSTAND3 domain-containing NTPase n=1 Tax=Spirosoma panaciterrae TaxID=496058 RepID=UPI00036CC057|nr:PUA domain-containing protein [Spirosoma panaciterrae]
MIEIVDLGQTPQEISRIMICQLNSAELNWQMESGLHYLQNDDKINLKTRDFLSVAKQNSVDVILFPELSIPQKQVEKLQEWSKQQECIIIGGSHYYENNAHIISRCPVIIKGDVYFTEKINLSPLEKSPILNEGAKRGNKIIRFTNTFVGDFAVLICADYLEDHLKNELDLQLLDILFVPAFQRDSNMYYRRMNIDCENSQNGIFICYSNFIDSKYGDGNSALFGIMDRMYSDKIAYAGYTDQNPDKKIVQFSSKSEYFIFDLNVNNKRPFANRNIETSPNVQIVSTNSGAQSKDFNFLKKISHDDERYKRINELYVKPNEYEDILTVLNTKNIIFIVGDPGIGKTYTAVKILKEYFENGYEPIWIAGLEKEERELQSKVLRDFEPTDNQIVYFEDPFGRTVFEKRDSLFQIFSPLIDKLTNSNCKIIITSRKEIFENFAKESLLEREILRFKEELNVNKPSYNKGKLIDIFNQLVIVFCDWEDNEDYKKLVYDAINNGALTTPLAIRDLVFSSRNIKSIEELSSQINRRKSDTVRVFSLEILYTSINTKLILFLTYFVGAKGKPFLSELYNYSIKELVQNNLSVNSFTFNIEMRSQLGFRIEQYGYNKTAYKFSHPIYEEALSSLIISDSSCEIIAKVIINEIIKVNIKLVYSIINRLVTKSPDVAFILLHDLLERNIKLGDSKEKYLLTQNLISIYYQTKKEEFFELACQIYPLKSVIFDIHNNFTSWKELSIQLNICQRYINLSPLSFDASSVGDIDWVKILSNKSDYYFNHSQTLQFLTLCCSINPVSLHIFIKLKGSNLIKKIFLFSDLNDRKILFKLLRGHFLQKELKRYRIELEKLEDGGRVNKYVLFKRVLFSEHKYYGKIFIDPGAYKAIRKPWANLLPIGITDIYGDFEAGSLIGLFTNNKLVAVGISEFSSKDLTILKGHQSHEFFNLIDYYHTTIAVKKDFLKLLYDNQLAKWIYVND